MSWGATRLPMATPTCPQALGHPHGATCDVTPSGGHGFQDAAVLSRHLPELQIIWISGDLKQTPQSTNQWEKVIYDCHDQ